MDFSGFEGKLDGILRITISESLEAIPDPTFDDIRDCLYEQEEDIMYMGDCFAMDFMSDYDWIELWGQNNRHSYVRLFDEYDSRAFMRWISDAILEYYRAEWM